MKHTRAVAALMVMGFAILACLSPNAPATDSPPAATVSAGPDLAATAAAADAAEAAAATVEAQLEAEAATEEQAELDDAATAEAEETEQAEADRAATREQATADAAEREVALTARAEGTRTEATAQARSLASRVAELAEAGYLTRADGRYAQADDFSESWAQINWYQWWWTGYAPSDFVVRANFHWNSASDNANWFNSGCGFVFREQAEEPYDHYLAYLGLDGQVYIERARNGTLTLLGSSRYGALDIPEGEANFLLAVDGNKFTVYVNDERVVTVLDGGRAEGYLNFTLVSGTNRDYGTLCEITEVELWELNEVRP
jgi:hypothetical protein